MRNRNTATLKLENIRIIGINDFTEVNGFSAFFPGLSDEQLEKYRELYPDLYEGDNIDPFTYFCYIITNGEKVILIDAGVGGGPDWGLDFQPAWKGSLIDKLGKLAFSPTDVDIVLFTHIHADHIGWAVLPDGKGGYKKTFPNAKYYAPAADYPAYLDGKTSPSFPDGCFETCVKTLFDNGELTLVSESRTEIAPGIEYICLPGHTPGASCIKITSGDDVCVLTGDIYGGALQVSDTSIDYVWDLDREKAGQSREEIMKMKGEGKFYIGGCHFGLGEVVNKGEDRFWQEISD